ncbi:MAG: 4a-hydroxytetrahydrobiopterin dehydratase [Actinomycetota bacterium]|nr:4a-hydroxytetrahydrobiopterin dehydratase [Actinomycetota bacterium]
MAAGEQWKQEGDAIVRDLEFEDFKAAMAAVNRVADVAEEANRHPDILVHDYNRVRLMLTTHSERRVTDADHEMAGRIDGVL